MQRPPGTLYRAPTKTREVASAAIHGVWRVELFLGELAAGVEIVEIQDGVEHERVCAARLAAVDRVDGEEDDMAVPGGNIDYGSVLRDFVAAFDKTGDEQVFGVGVAEND